VPLLDPNEDERTVSSWDSDADDPLSSKQDPPGILEQIGLSILRKWRTLCSHGVWSEQLYVVFVICFFAGSSLGAIFINKTCLTGYQFRFPLTLMVGQMVFAVSVLGVFHLTRYMIIPPLRKQDMLIMAIPTILFTSNIVVGLSALNLVNIPMFSALRRLTLLFVMCAEYVFLRKTHRPAIVISVVVMTFGAFISAVDDVSFSRLGYILVFLNNILTATYLTAIKRVMKDTRFQPLSILFYTALMGLPLVALLMFATSEISEVIRAFVTQPELSTPSFAFSLVLSASGAFAVNFSTTLCTQITSPLTTSVAGQVKNVLQTVLGFFSWGFVPTFLNMSGLLIALAAQLMFAYFKYQEHCKSAKAAMRVVQGSLVDINSTCSDGGSSGDRVSFF
jgi:solute carrier family 35